jgi:hypothetical protein
MSVASNSSGAYERSTGIPSSASFTACFWFRWTAASLSGNFFQSAFSIDNTSGASYMQFGSGGGASTQINLYCGAGTGTTAVVDPGTAWYFYAVKGTSTSASTVYHRAASANALTSAAAGGAATPNRVYVLTDSNTPNQRADLGEIYAVKIWDAQLSDAEILAESYFVAPQRRTNLNSFYPFFKAGTVDEGGNAYTLTALGTPIDSNNVPPIRTRRGAAKYFLPLGPGSTNGAAAITLGVLTSSATGTSGGVTLSGSRAKSYFDEHANAISWFIDEMPLTDGVSGTAAITLGALTVSGVGDVDVNGTSAVTLGTLTSTAVGAVAIDGDAAITLGTLTASGTGTVSDAPITGTASITLGVLTLSGVGDVDVAGASAITLGVLTSAAAGAVAIDGDASITLGALTSSAAGDVDVSGAAAVTLGTLTSAAVGDVDVAGSAAITLGALTVSGVGDVDVRGTSAVTLGAVTTSATGVVGNPPVIGTADVALVALTSAATGSVAVQGAASVSLAALGCSGAGTVAIAGTLAATLGELASSGSGTVAIVGSAATVLDALTSSASGSVAVVGSASVTLGELTLSATGGDVSQRTGTAAITLGALTCTGLGIVSYQAEEYDGETYTVSLRDMPRQRVVIAAPTVCSVVLADMPRQRVMIADPERIEVVLADMRIQTVRLAYSIRRTSGAAAVTLGSLTSSGAAVLGVDVYDDMNALVTDDLLEQVTHGIA